MTRTSDSHLMNPVMLTATSVLRSLQRISRCALSSLDASAAETSGLSSSGDFSSVMTHAVSPPGRLWRGPLPRVGGGSIKAVVTFEPLAVVLDLTAGAGRVLRLRPDGEDSKGASDDQRGSHAPMRADRVAPCKVGERSAVFAIVHQVPGGRSFICKA